MTIGEKIKKFRTERGLSQKHLAHLSGMSEPAIRNYELGNRCPGEKQLEKIASALEISPFALADPNFDSYNGLIHALFQIEDLYGLKPLEIDGQIVLSFDPKCHFTITDILHLWHKMSEDAEKEVIERKEYDCWRYDFPRSEAIREKHEREA